MIHITLSSWNNNQIKGAFKM